MTGLVIASLLFVAMHLLPSLPLRAVVVGRIGLRAWLGLFSLASGVLLVWMILAYADASPGEALWVAGIGWRNTMAALMLPAFVLVVLGALAPNPAAVMAGGLLQRTTTPAGILAVTRHPLNTGIALWAALHLVARPEAPALVFFGSLLATAVPGSVLQDRRKAVELGQKWNEWRAKTSAIPFASMLAGRSRLAFSRADWLRLAIAVAAWAAMLHLHGWLIGVPVGL